MNASPRDPADLGSSSALQDRGSITYLSLICLVATLGGLLFGYDTAVIAGAIGFLEQHFSLTAGSAEGWAAACALAGCALGAAVAGPLSDRLGRKKTLLVSAVLFIASSIGTAIPQSFLVFVIFRLIGGVGIGAASMTSPMYIAEVSPARLRGRMVSLNQFAIVTGMLLVGIVNYAIARSGSDTWNADYGWRWMFGSGTLPAVLFFFLLLPVPESPRWLTEQGYRERARAVLARVNGTAVAERELAAIEEAIAKESGSLRQLFEPGLRTVLAIGIALAVLQQVTGINVFLYFAPQIFKRIAGEGTEHALLQTVVVNAVNMLFTVVAIWTVDRLGRKPLMIVGFLGMSLALVALSLAAYTQQTGVWTLAFMLGYIACFALSVGPVTWVLLAEIFPTRIRGRAMAIATVCLWLANVVVTWTFPMLDKDPRLVEKFHHAFPFWVYAGLSMVALLFVIRWVPETKGRSLEEIERQWLRRPDETPGS
jgi:sugar porter (SP) family MFS transporter